MIKGDQILAAIALLEQERKISPEITIEALKEGIIKAYHRDVDPQATVQVDIDNKTGDIKVFNCKAVVDEIEDDMTQLSLEQAQMLNKNYKVGDTHYEPVEFDSEFSRIATQQVALTLKQKLKETEKTIIHELFKDKVNTVVMAQVESVDKAGVILTINNVPAFLPSSLCIKDEKIRPNTNISVCITDVTLESKGAQVVVSRISPEFVRSLLIQNVPELKEGLLTIEAIERVAGKRTKIVVKSTDENLDPIGTCVGKGGERTKAIEKHLPNEKIEIARWSEDQIELIKSIFSPATLVSIEVQDELINVIVPDDKYSLALSGGGINVKISAHIAHKKIRLYKESEYEAEGITNLNNGGMDKVFDSKPNVNKNDYDTGGSFDEGFDFSEPETTDTDDKGDFEFNTEFDSSDNDFEEKEFVEEEYDSFDSDDLYK